jgi:uncharacterized protein YjbJ (UPF0337 family)
MAARMVGRVPEVTCPHRRATATLQHLSRYAAANRPATAARTASPREGSTMNWNNIENGWSDYKANAKQQWSKLSDEQIDDTMGKREQLSSRVQEAYSVNREEAERQIADWQSKLVQKQAPAQS